MSFAYVPPGTVGPYNAGGGQTVSGGGGGFNSTDPEWRFPGSEQDAQEALANPAATAPLDPRRFPGQGTQSFILTD